MVDLRGLGIVAVIAAIMAYAYFIYVRPALGKTVATPLALFVFLMLVALIGGEICGRRS